MKLYLGLALGGALGTLARFLLQGLVQPPGTAFPYGTLVVNVSGSFVLGFLMRYLLASTVASPELRAWLTIGFCGGFTTMSTFAYETVTLLRDGQIPLGLGYLAATIVGSLAALVAGQFLAGALL